MTPIKFEGYIKEAYEGRNRNVIQATGMLQCEAAELAELYLKEYWYNKEFTREDVVSEAGDILNFLTFILQFHNLTLEDAMLNNVLKLKERGWVK